MNTSNYRFTLDLHSAQSQISIPALLGDTGRAFHISFSDGGKPYEIPDGVIAKISIKRPTRTRIEDFCEIENNTTAVYKFEQNTNTCAVPGIHDIDVTLYDIEGKRIASPRFTMVVSNTVVRHDDIVLTDEDFTAIDAIMRAEAMRQHAERSRVVVEEERVEAEIERSAAESARAAAETERSEAEVARIAAEEGRISAESQRVTNEDARKVAEQERVAKDNDREANVALAVNASNTAVEKATAAVVTATTARDIANRTEQNTNSEIASFKATLGSEALTTGYPTIKGSVNYAVSTADSAKQQSDVVRANLINITAQVNGIGRTYVVPNFLSFIDFIKSNASILLSEDRNGDGVNETYNIYVSDLKTGDNIIITEDGVPDFWVEKNAALTSFKKYTYKGVEYTLSAVANGNIIGGAYILETDYTVIENYAVSASASASDAAESAAKALQSEGNAALSAAASKVSETNAKAAEIAAEESVAEAKLYGAHAYDLAIRNDKRLTNLESGILPDPFETDASAAYVKDVPEKALPYAELTRIGGMTSKCVNLIPFPYYDGGVGTSVNRNGLTYTVNADGGIRRKGTSTGITTFELTRSLKFEVGKTYASNLFVSIRFSDGSVKYAFNTFTWQESYSEATEIKVYTQTSANTTLDDVFYPMLNEGSVLLPYEQYFDGLRSAKVTAVESIGANASSITTPVNGYFYTDAGTETPAHSGYIRFYVNDVKPNTIYTISSNLKFYWIIFDDGKNPITASSGHSGIMGTGSYKHTFTTPSNCHRLRVTLINTNGQMNTNAFEWFMINKGETALPYAPHTKNTFPIPEAVQALDGYGKGVNESIYNYIDFEKRQFVKRVGMVDMSTLNWSSWWDESINPRRAYARIPTKAKGLSNMLCGRYALANVADGSMSNDSITGNASTDYIYVKDTSYSTFDEWKASLPGVMLCYELATPEVIDISDVLSADNYIGIEGGGTLTFANDRKQAVPSEVTYQLKEATV